MDPDELTIKSSLLGDVTDSNRILASRVAVVFIYENIAYTHAGNCIVALEYFF